MLFLLLTVLWSPARAQDTVRQVTVTYAQIADGRPKDIPEGFIEAYQTQEGETVSVGDPLDLGAPTGRSIEATYASSSATGIQTSWFTYVTNGTYSASVKKAVLNNLGGSGSPTHVMAPATLSGVEVHVQRIKLAGTRKRPVVWMECKLPDQKEKTNASGIVTILDIDVAERAGEVHDPRHITNDIAIQKIKKAKQLLDLGVYTQQQFDAVKKKYAPYITPP